MSSSNADSGDERIGETKVPSWSLLRDQSLMVDVEKSKSQNTELFNVLLQRKNVKIEQIVSTGQTTPVNEVYDQEWDEFVLLMQGEAKITMVDTQTTIALSAGDSVMIKAHEKHVVSYTSSEPPCIWLAVHFAPDPQEWENLRRLW